MKFHLKNTYYTGRTAKVVKVLANMLVKKELFSATNIENEDSKNSNKKCFASNIICFFER